MNADMLRSTTVFHAVFMKDLAEQALQAKTPEEMRERIRLLAEHISTLAELASDSVLADEKR